MHKTGTEPGHMAGTIRGVYCRPQACQSFAAVWWSSSCRLRARLCGERAAQAEAEVERSEGEGEAQGRSVVGGALRFWGVGVDFALD